MMVTLIFHGALRAALGGLKEFRCEARTPAEAINAVFSQIKPTPPKAGRRWVLTISGCNSRQALYSPIGSDTLHIMPAMCGARNVGAFIQIAIAVVLIAVSIVLAPYMTPVLANTLFAIGVSMAIGGTIQLLMPAPSLSANKSDNPEDSRYLGAARNTTDSGTRIPIGYGRDKVAGHYIHFDVEAEPAPIFGQPPRADQRRLMGVTV